MKITGVMVQYYVACKRELWFFLHQINMNYEDDNILLGRHIHKESYKREKKNIMIDNTINVDFVKKEKGITVFEIKKSSRLEEPVRYQLYYYLYYLKYEKSINAKGRLVYPKERKTEELYLTPEIEKELEDIMKGIEKVAAMEKPPPPKRKPYCKKCSYYELCWV